MHNLIIMFIFQHVKIKKIDNIAQHDQQALKNKKTHGIFQFSPAVT